MTVGWGEVWTLVPYAVAAATVLVLMRRLLDVLGLGDEEAAGLGVDVVRVRRLVVLAATLATAAAVSVSGLIAFVGIIVPHTIRLLTGWSYRVIIPLSLVYGASFLIVADSVARTVVAPARAPHRRRDRLPGRPVLPAGPAVDERLLMISWRDVVVSFNGVTVVGPLDSHGGRWRMGRVDRAQRRREVDACSRQRSASSPTRVRRSGRPGEQGGGRHRLDAAAASPAGRDDRCQLCPPRSDSPPRLPGIGESP